MLLPAVAGLAFLMAFGRRGLVGHYLDMLGIDIAFTTIAAGGSVTKSGADDFFMEY